MVGLVVELHEDAPTGLVGVPMARGLAVLSYGLIERLEQWGNGVQSVGEASAGQSNAVSGQVGDQAMAGTKEQELVQQHLDPDGDAVASLGDEFRGGGGGDDAAVAGAATGGAIARAADEAAMGADLDFDGFGIFGAGERDIRQSAIGTVSLVRGEIMDFFDDGQMVVASSLGCGVAGLLTA